MQSMKRTRRSRNEWRKIIDSWQSSHQSAPEFCQANGLPYASFSQWRRRLAETALDHSQSGGFLNLSSLNDQFSTAWNITLKLGKDVELVLTRQ